jgi:hypothetical protein
VSDTRKQPPHHFKHVDMKPCCMACMHNTAEFDHDFISCDVHKFTMPDVALFRVCDNFKGGYGEKNECDSVVELLKQKVARLEGSLALAYFGIRELKSQFEFCDCSDDPQDDICLHCILGNIMHDIEKQKGVGGGE